MSNEPSEWVFRNAEIINNNFRTIHNKLKRDIVPTMGMFRKFITKQKYRNQKVALFMTAVGVYIYYNEKRQRDLENKLDRLGKEVDKLKGESDML